MLLAYFKFLNEHRLMIVLCKLNIARSPSVLMEVRCTDAISNVPSGEPEIDTINHALLHVSVDC